MSPLQINYCLSKRGNIGIKGTRVAGKILVWGELCRIDENRDDHVSRAASRKPYQRKVAWMERPHGRNKCDRLTAIAQSRHGPAERGQGAHAARLAGLRDSCHGLRNGSLAEQRREYRCVLS